jgi:hypothetical protein
MRNMQRPIASEHEQGIHFKALDAFDDLVGDIHGDFLSIPDYLTSIRIAAIGRPQDGAAARQKPADILDPKPGYPPIVYKSIVTIPDADHLTPVFIDRGLDYGADHSVQAGRIPSARQNSDSLHHSLLA